MNTDRRTQILFIQQNSHVGGAEISQANLLKALDKGRYHPILVLPNGDPGWRLFEITGVDTWVVPIDYFKRTCSPIALMRGLLHFWQSIRALVARMDELSVPMDIVHTGSMSAQLHAAMLRKRRDLSAVWHVRDIVPQDYFGRILVRWCSGGADKVIAISEAVRDSLLEVGVSPTKCQVVPNAVDLDLFDVGSVSSEAFREELGLVVDTPLIVHIGKVIPAKGQDLFIRAMPAVLEIFPKAHFVIIGGVVPGWEEYADRLEQIAAELGLAKNLSMLEFRLDIREVIAAADLVINSSRMAEPFGRTIIEAMAMEKPVIGPNHGGVPEIIVDGVMGSLFTPGSHHDLARSILALLSNPQQLHRMGVAGRNRVECLFSLKAHACQIQSIYDELSDKAGIL